MSPRLILQSILALVLAQTMVSCASDKPKRRERVPPPAVGDSSLPWNRPPKWEGNAKYGSMMQGSR
ncbi:hypothetical protein EI77_01763 [Prosthecobacter fusiformis]|uniref:Lipoprotein n=1 Tax=Prosthecobacter fusiformis TaxID=48464 RepID=A0A4V3FG51_9BACT|nr:hypothetical protein [Prosthecobacter fusiformis]TDU73293.1 hypothetical protein EI77_01763 [Prosthecobacter fusiformis]